ncbi:MAG: hypothetical protein CMK59_06035 [Proteobacteria bacterium]|nr:hypothetical protein [Pseudomonadota bacterium]
MPWIFLSCQSIFYPLIEPAVSLPANNLLVYHSCDTRIKDCFDPMLHEIQMAYSEDGHDWTIWDELPQISGSVPDILIRDSVLYIYSLPELHRLDLITGSWLPTIRARVFDDKGNMVIHVDPSPVLDENNNIVLFFLKGVPGIDPATCSMTENSCTKEFLSATELAGSKGARFRIDRGIRTSVNLKGPGDFASDPDVFQDPNGYVMYISRGQATHVYRSKTLQGSYVFEKELTNTGGGVPAGYYHFNENMYWSFTSKHVAQPWMQEIRMSEHPSLEDFPSFKTAILPVNRNAPIMQASPGFWKEPIER